MSLADSVSTAPLPPELESVADQPVVLSPRQLATIVRSSVEDALRRVSNNDAPEGLLTRKELAQRLRCSTATIDRQVARGMPMIRLGDDRRFRFEAVVAWLNNGSA